MKVIRFISVVVYGAVLVAASPKNNVCQKIQDYNTKFRNTSNCWYNPDVDLTVPEIISRNQYPLETYKVLTRDGYILQLFRILNGRNVRRKEEKGARQPIFLQHGLFSNSAPWVVCGNNSIGFILSDMGYDVWLGNSRGSTYGKGHVRFSVNETRYWNFSYHEMGVYDLPASLDLVYKVTGRNDIIFVGQSMGTHLPYVYASTMADHANKRLKLIVSLAPTVFLLNVKAPVFWLAPFWPLAKKLNKYLMMKEILGSQINNLMQGFQAMCFISEQSFTFCEIFIFLLFGFDFTLPAEFLPLIYGHYPAGSSLNTVLHMAQGAQSGRFAHFDYGTRTNLQYYKSARPPPYNLSRIKIPSYIMYAANDWVATEQGAMALYNKLPVKIGLEKLSNELYNHVDFFFGRDIVDVLVKNLLRIVNKYKV